MQQDQGFVPGKPLELGAEFIHGDVNPIVELCEAHGWSRRHIFTWSHGDGGPADGPAPDGGVGYYYLGREQRLLAYDDADADMARCNEALWALQAHERSAAERDRRSLRQYLVDEGVPERMLGLACAGYGNTAGGTADSVPVTRAMRYERAWHGDGSELDPDFRLEPSFGVLIDHLARGLRIETGCPVAVVEADAAAAASSSGDGFPCAVVTRDGRRLRARRVVVTVPLPVLRDGDIRFSPPLSAAKVAAAQSMSFANGVKVVLKFSRPAWPANCHGVVCADSLIPEMWMNRSGGVGGLIQGVQCKYGAASEADAEDADDAGGSMGGSGSGSSGGDEVTSLTASMSLTARFPAAGGGGSARASASGRNSADRISGGGDEVLDADADGATTTADGEGYEDDGEGVDEDGAAEALDEAEADEEESGGGDAGAGGAPRVFLVTGFVMGVRADALLRENSQALIVARMLSQIDAMFGLDAPGAFIDGFVHNWGQEEFIRGAYSTPTVREHDDASRRLAEPHLGLVFFAGEATAGTVEGHDRVQPQHAAHFAPPIVLHGAMNTGSRAACEVARSLGLPVTCTVDGAAHAHFQPSYVGHGGAHGYGHFKARAAAPLAPAPGDDGVLEAGGKTVSCEVLRRAFLARDVAEAEAAAAAEVAAASASVELV